MTWISDLRKGSHDASSSTIDRCMRTWYFRLEIGAKVPAELRNRDASI